jgi:hypothetical protein
MLMIENKRRMAAPHSAAVVGVSPGDVIPMPLLLPDDIHHH